MGVEDDNIKFFRDKVDWYDNNPLHKKAHEAISKAFEKYNSWIGIDWISSEERSQGSREVRLLDYACGTGVVTRRLSPYITHAHGIDITPEMVDSFNAQASAAGLPASQISAITGNLLRDPVEPAELMGSDYHNFDIVVVGLGYHHFEDPANAASRLAERLKPGGVLLLLDIVGHKHAKVDDEHVRRGVKTHGFTEPDMRQIYEDAGLVDFGFVVLEEPLVMERNGETISKTLFLSRGVKPEA